jgi:hypothetical protein
MRTRHLYWILTGPSFAVQKPQRNCTFMNSASVLSLAWKSDHVFMSTQTIKVSSRQSLHNLQYSAPALWRQHWQHWINSRMLWTTDLCRCEQKISVTHQTQLGRVLRTTALCHSSNTTLQTTDFCNSSKTALQNVANNRFLSFIKNNSAECCEQQIFVTHQ